MAARRAGPLGAARAAGGGRPGRRTRPASGHAPWQRPPLRRATLPWRKGRAGGLCHSQLAPQPIVVSDPGRFRPGSLRFTFCFHRFHRFKSRRSKSDSCKFKASECRNENIDTLGAFATIRPWSPTMWRYLVAAVAFGSPGIGCQHVQRSIAGVCTPESTVAAPAPKIEVQTPETIVVKSPTPKVVLQEQSEECDETTCTSGGRCRRQCAQPVCSPTAYSAHPQMGYGAAPPYGAAPAYGAPMMGGEIKDRTAVGLMFDTIKIPLPWIRLKAIPQPAEVTFRSQLPPGYGSPVMMPMAGYGTAPVAYGAPPVAYGAPPPVAYGAPPPVAYGAPPPVAYGAAPVAYGAPPPAYGTPPAVYS